MTLPATQLDSLITEFHAACDDLRDTIARVPDDRWQVPTPGDGRPVNVVAHHAASSHGPIAHMIQAMGQGQPASLSMDQIDAGNAEHARRFGACSKAETLELNEQGAAAATAMLRGLSEDRLAIAGEFLIGRPATVEQAIRRVLINHPREHAATLRAALT
jgi:hypothetical protein